MARPRVADQRQEEILAAFEACVVRQGLEKTTLEDVAREAGQQRSLVRHFAGNRDDLVAALIERMVRRSEARLRAASRLDGPGSGPALAALLLGDFFDDPVTNAVMAELWHIALRAPNVAARLTAVYRRVLEDLASRLSPPGVAPDAATADAVHALFSLGLGALVLRRFGLGPTDPARLVDLAARMAPTPLTPAPLNPTSTTETKRETP
jgi:AcrR family transcriptional regulator